MVRLVDSLRADHPDPAADRRLSLAVATDGADSTGQDAPEPADFLVTDADRPLPPPLVAGDLGDEVAADGFRLAGSEARDDLAAALGARRVVRARPPADVDLDRTETWDPVLATLTRRAVDAEITIAFAVATTDRLFTLFHTAISWLGFDAGRVRAVRLDWLGGPVDEAAAVFGREKERHCHLERLDLPEFDWLAPEHQFPALAGPAWAYAGETERPPTLSRRQLFALRLYTTEFYQAYHRALRAGRGDDPTYRQVLPLVDCLDAGLANLPALPGLTYRGERGDAEQAASRRAWAAGGELEELSYVSTSRNELHAAAMRRGFLFRIRGRSGRDISAFSEFPWEQEVLFGRGLVQRLTSKDCSADAIAEECDFETEEVSIGRRWPA